MIFKKNIQNMKYIIVLLFLFIIVSSFTYVVYNNNNEGFIGNYVNSD